MDQIYREIEAEVAGGAAPQYLGANLIARGWPPGMVNEAVNAWLAAHGRLQHKTDFRAWLAKYRYKALPSTIILVLISVISSSVLLLQPWPTKILVDSGFGSIPAPGPLRPYTHQPTLILLTSLLTIGIFLLGVLFGSLRDYMNIYLGFRLNRSIKEESFRHILHLPLFHQERLAKGDYIYRQNILTNSLSDLVLDTTSRIAQSVIMVLGIFFIMMRFNFRLTIVSVILVPFLFLLIRVFGPRLGRISRELTKTNSATSAVVTESVDNAETLQAFTLEEKMIDKANQLWWKNYRLSLRALLWGRLYRFSNSLLIILATSSVMYFGGTAALDGQMTLGQLLIYMTYMGYLLGPVESLATEIAARNQKKVDVSRVYEVLTDHEGIENLRQNNHFPMFRGRIEFQNVNYSYNQFPILHNVNLVVEPGEKVGIIGPSGGGKTTLLKLLPLFVEPTGGRILIDNIDIQSVSLQELRQHIVWISQTPQLFNETIAENLADANVYRRIDQTEIDKAITAANVKEFSERMPLGLSSPAGENGNSLSGGQKQRIAIARGLLKASPIVCMDEPTAALDAKSENTIRDSIAKLIDGKTVLMVTHRKALLSLMDKIYVMDSGKLHEVSEFGGLDAYLRKISDTEVDEKQRQREAARQQQELAEMARLEAEKEALQAKLAEQESAVVENGTVYINH